MVRNRVFVLALLLPLVLGLGAAAEAKSGTLELIGVPEDVSAGHYHTESGVFFVDVSGLEEALIVIRFQEMEITGKKLEWHTKDDYFIFRDGAQLEKEDFRLVSNILEYFGEKEKLIAQGEVEVISDETTVRSQSLVYEEAADKALFTKEVIVILEEGTLQGEKFLMDRAKNELTFFGAFQGEFETNSN